MKDFEPSNDLLADKKFSFDKPNCKLCISKPNFTSMFLKGTFAYYVNRILGFFDPQAPSFEYQFTPMT